jgi:hypothetical protein
VRQESGLAQHRDEERERIMRNEDEDRRRDENTRRAEQLRDAWRRRLLTFEKVSSMELRSGECGGR